MNNFQTEDFRKALQKSYTEPPKNLVVRTLAEIKQQEAEVIFMDIYSTYIHDSLDKQKFKLLLRLFIDAKKDLSFISRKDFIPRCFLDTDTVEYPVPDYISKRERQYRVNFFPIYTMLYKDTHRLPKLNSDVKEHIQGYVTGYIPREKDPTESEKQKLIAFIERLMPYSGASHDWSLERLKDLARTLQKEELEKERQVLLMKIKMLSPFFKDSPKYSVENLRERLTSLQKSHRI